MDVKESSDARRRPAARKVPYPGWAGPRQPPRDPLKELVNWVKSVLWSMGFASFLLVLLLSFIIVMAMTPEIQQWITTPQPLDDDATTLELPYDAVFIITPWPVALFYIRGAAFQAWHLLMLGMLIWAFASAKHDLFRNWLSKSGRILQSMRTPEKATSSMEAVAKLFMACMFFSVVYFIFLELIGVTMKSPDFSSMARPELIYRLFQASVFEELISRVLLVGVPLVLIGLWLNRKDPKKRLLGGGLSLTPITFGLIIFSAVIFAFAHVGSWDYWKIPQVLVPGLALGWAFVRYGLHASILIHFSINLSTVALDIWPDDMLLTMLLGMAILIWMAAGGYFFLHYCIELAGKFAGKKKAGNGSRSVLPPPSWVRGQDASAPPPAVGEKVDTQPKTEPPGSPAPAGFICPKCGNMSASYDSGKLTCLRCGATHQRDTAQEKKDAAPEKVQIEF